MPAQRFRGAREAPLFSALAVDPAGEALVTGDGDVRLYRGWLAPVDADALLAEIRARVVWKQERRTMYDRVVDVPREQAWYGDGPLGLVAGPMWPALADVRTRLETLAGARFAYVLFNKYRDGSDSVAWHNDREVAHVARPAIASLTLGATRAFDIRSKADRRRVKSIDLDHGDLLVMRGETQTNYEHRVGKDARIAGERVNLTFRQHEQNGDGSIEQEFDSAGRRGVLR